MRRRCTEFRKTFEVAASATARQCVCSIACRGVHDRKLACRRRRREHGGPGDYRVTAYGSEPAGLQCNVVTIEIGARRESRAAEDLGKIDGDDIGLVGH
jgi:hypothetical protein